MRSVWSTVEPLPRQHDDVRCGLRGGPCHGPWYVPGSTKPKRLGAAIMRANPAHRTAGTLERLSALVAGEDTPAGCAHPREPQAIERDARGEAAKESVNDLCSTKVRGMRRRRDGATAIASVDDSVDDLLACAVPVIRRASSPFSQSPRPNARAASSTSSRGSVNLSRSSDSLRLRNGA